MTDLLELAGQNAPAANDGPDLLHLASKPALGTRENPIDSPQYAAGLSTIARASLPPDEKVQMQRYAEAFKQPLEDFAVMDGQIIRKIPSTGQYARVQPSVKGATGPIDAAHRAAEWVVSGAGPAIPAVTSAAGAAAAAILATPETLGAGTLPAGMAGGAAGGAAGEVGRQKLDALLAPEGQEAPMDWENVGWQGAAGAAGPIVGKVVEAASPVVKEGLKDMGRVLATETSVGTPLVAAATDRAGVTAATKAAGSFGLSERVVNALKDHISGKEAELEALRKEAQEMGVDLSLGQLTGSEAVRQAERQLIRQPETVQAVTDLREAQNTKQIPDAVRNVMDEIAPDAPSGRQVSAFREGADATVKAAEDARAKDAEPLYTDAFKANKSISSPKIDELLDTPEGKDALKYAIRRMRNRMRDIATPDPELTEQLRLLVARDEMPVGAAKNGVAEGLNLETLDLVKQGLWDSEDALRKQVIAGTARKGEVDEVSSIRRSLTNELDRLDATAQDAGAGGLPIEDMKAAMRKAGKLPPEQVDSILAHVDDMIKANGSAEEALNSEIFPKGQEDWYKAALSAAEDHANGVPSTGGNGNGLYKQARQKFGDPSDEIDAMKEGGIGFIQRMTGPDRQNMITRIFSGTNLFPEEIASMRRQFFYAGKSAEWNAGVRSYIADALAEAVRPLKTGGEPANVGGALYKNLFEDRQAKVLLAALGHKEPLPTTPMLSSDELKTLKNFVDPTGVDGVVDVSANTSKLNKFLRSGKFENSQNSPMGRDVQTLDGIFEKTAPVADEARVYRGVGLDDQQLAQLKEGGTFTDRSFMSTSGSAEEAQHFAGYDRDANMVVMDIKVPKGGKMVDVGKQLPDSGYSNEKEFVLPRDSQFKINKVTKADGVTRVEMEMIPPETPAPSAAEVADNARSQMVIERWNKLGRVLKAASKQLPEGSATATDLGSPGLMQRVGQGIKYILKPQAMGADLMDGLTKVQEPEEAKKLATTLLTSEGDKLLRSLAPVTPGTPKANSILTKMLIQAGVVTAVDQARGPGGR